MENPVNGANDHNPEVEPNGEEDGAVDVDAQVFLLFGQISICGFLFVFFTGLDG
jgi:hypothetical protein